MTINPRGDPSDKVSNPCYSALSQPSAVTPERFLLAGFAVCGGGSVVAADDWGEWYCMPFHRVVRITEGVSATVNAVSEEEKLRKLCGLLCECS